MAVGGCSAGGTNTPIRARPPVGGSLEVIGGKPSNCILSARAFDDAGEFQALIVVDALKAETIIRDLFKARTGRTMNELRETLVEREEKLTDGQKRAAYDYASGVGEMIEKGNKISFHRAFTHQAQALASELGITDAGAKRLMKEEFSAASGKDLYEHGKAVEEQFYRPQIEAEKQKAETRGSTQEHSSGNRDSADDRSDGRRPSESQRGHSGDRHNSTGSSRSRVGPRP